MEKNKFNLENIVIKKENKITELNKSINDAKKMINIKNKEIINDKKYINNLKEVIKDLKQEFNKKNILKKNHNKFINLNNKLVIKKDNLRYRNNYQNQNKRNDSMNYISFNKDMNIIYKKNNEFEHPIKLYKNNYGINSYQNKNKSVPNVKHTTKRKNNKIKIYKITNFNNKIENKFIISPPKLKDGLMLKLFKKPLKLNKIKNKIEQDKEDNDKKNIEEVKELFDKIIDDFDK